MDTSTQAAKILKLIKASGRRGTPNFRLAGISLKYSSRISELRHEGHNIVAERQLLNGRATNVWNYYLSSKALTPKPKARSNEVLRELMIAKSRGIFGCYQYINNRIKEITDKE